MGHKCDKGRNNATRWKIFRLLTLLLISIYKVHRSLMCKMWSLLQNSDIDINVKNKYWKEQTYPLFRKLFRTVTLNFIAYY